jgi:hypothetical protein
MCVCRLAVEVWERVLAFLPDQVRQILAQESWGELDGLRHRFETRRVGQEFVRLEQKLRARQLDLDEDLEPDADCDGCTTRLLGWDSWSCPFLELDFCDNCWDGGCCNTDVLKALTIGPNPEATTLSFCKECHVYGHHNQMFTSHTGMEDRWAQYNVRTGSLCHDCSASPSRLVQFLRLERIPIEPVPVDSELETASSHLLLQQTYTLMDVRSVPTNPTPGLEWMVEITPTRMDNWLQLVNEIFYWQPELDTFLRWAPVTNPFRIRALDSTKRKFWSVVLLDCFGDHCSKRFAFASWWTDVGNDTMLQEQDNAVWPREMTLSSGKQRCRIVLARNVPEQLTTTTNTDYVRSLVDANLPVLGFSSIQASQFN